MAHKSSGKLRQVDKQKHTHKKKSTVISNFIHRLCRVSFSHLVKEFEFIFWEIQLYGGAIWSLWPSTWHFWPSSRFETGEVLFPLLANWVRSSTCLLVIVSPPTVKTLINSTQLFFSFFFCLQPYKIEPSTRVTGSTSVGCCIMSRFGAWVVFFISITTSPLCCFLACYPVSATWWSCFTDIRRL